MKILTLVWSIGIGGTERAAVNYAIGYKKYGVDSRVLVLGEGHERHVDLIAANVATVLVTQSEKGLESILKEFAEWEPDVIHIHNYRDDLLPFIQKINGLKTKIVETNVFSRPCFSEGYSIVNLSMQLSQWGYWKYSRWMKHAAYCPQSAVVPYIVDDSNFITPASQDIADFLREQNIPEGAFVVGRLGQAHPSKWDERIVKVIKQTIHPTNKIYYLFVGLPENIKILIDRQTNFFKSRVVCIEKIEGDKKLSLYYHSLNCFAHISLIGESFGFVLAEVMLCNTPVVSMLTPLRDNAQLEIIGNGMGGFCVTNVKQFVEKIMLLHNDESVYNKIHDTLKKRWIQSRFSFENVIPVQLKLYKLISEDKTVQPVYTEGILKQNFELFGLKQFIIKPMAKFVNHFAFLRLMAFIKK